MTPNKFYQLRRKHELTKRAKELADKHSNNTQDVIQKIAFKQEAGMMPEEWLKNERL